MRRPKIGDIVEIETGKGLAYALYTHRHTDPPRFGALLRVFDGIHAARPADISQVLAHRVRFSTFFPLGAAVNRGIVKIAGSVEIPEPLRAFPVFRNGTPDPKTKKVAVWWLWDGHRQWRAGRLTAGQKREYPLLEVINDTLLIARIEEGWEQAIAEW
ncbi:MAG TPA: hypothetical protein VM366_03665 [Anaerolineae bacterium]|nr:hypothetical protein [Anaerolineae bacterium]